MANKKKISEGELLKSLKDWTGLTGTDFIKPINRSRQWLHDAFKNEIIPQKDKIAICKAFKIPMEYFSGEYELPIEGFVNEPESAYANVSLLQKQIRELKDIIIQRDQLLIELQTKYIKLVETRIP